MMYDIIQNTTEEVSINNVFTGYSGNLASIVSFYDDWIVFTRYENTENQLYAYNFVEDIGRTLISTSLTDKSCISIDLNDEFIVYTRKDTTTNVYNIGVYNISSQKNAIISFPVSISEVRVTDIYDNYAGLRYNELGDIDGALLNVNGINWASSGWSNPTIYDPPTKTFNWIDLSDNITIFDDNDLTDISEIFIWENYVVYGSYISLANMNILVYNIESNNTFNLTDSIYQQRVYDIYQDKIAWSTNENSLISGTGDNVNFDIYRTQTDLEAVGQDIINMAPMIIVVLFFAFVLGAFLLFGRGGDSY